MSIASSWPSAIHRGSHQRGSAPRLRGVADTTTPDKLTVVHPDDHVLVVGTGLTGADVIGEGRHCICGRQMDLRHISQCDVDLFQRGEVNLECENGLSIPH